MGSLRRRLQRKTKGKVKTMQTLDLRAITTRKPGQNGKPGPRAIPATDSMDKPVLDSNGDQAWLLVEEFLLQRTGDSKFVEGLDAAEAIETQLTTRKEIREQIAIDDGLIVLEDSRGKRVIDATLKPSTGYRPDISHNLAPFLRAAKAPVDGDLRVKLKAEAANGAEPVEAPAN